MATATSLSNVSCSLINDDKVFREKDGVDQVVCLTDGRVLELSNGNVLGSCNTPYLNASEVSVFFSYDPFIKYYIMRQDTTLVILQKLQDSLEIFKTYENVQRYEISDFLVIGRPQVKIWLLDEMEPLVTDFSSCNLSNLNNPNGMQRISDLDRKLRMMQSSLMHVHKISKDRGVLKENYFRHSYDASSLVLSEESWQRIVNGYWIICVCIKNNYELPVNGLQLLIDNKYSNYIETKVCNFTYSNAKKLYSRNDLLPNCSAYVVGISNEPNFSRFKNNVISLRCSLLYTISNNGNSTVKELKLPSFVLNLENLMNNNLGIFQTVNDNLLPDIIICSAIHEVTLLEIQMKSIEDDTLLQSVLMKKFNFVDYRITENENMRCLISSPDSNSILSCMIIFVENVSINMYSLVCYSKNVNQAILFKQSLQAFLQNDLISMNLKKSDASDWADGSLVSAVNTLDEEFEHFTSTIRTAVPMTSSLPIKEENNLSITIETWKQLIESNLQFKTDVEFQKALKYDKI